MYRGATPLLQCLHFTHVTRPLPGFTAMRHRLTPLCSLCFESMTPPAVPCQGRTATNKLHSMRAWHLASACAAIDCLSCRKTALAEVFARAARAVSSGCSRRFGVPLAHPRRAPPCVLARGGSQTPFFGPRAFAAAQRSALSGHLVREASKVPCRTAGVEASPSLFAIPGAQHPQPGREALALRCCDAPPRAHVCRPPARTTAFAAHTLRPLGRTTLCALCRVDLCTRAGMDM